MRNTLVLLASALIAVVAAAADSPLVPPNEPIAGLSQAQWSIVWWQWARSFPDEQSPVADRTGARCAGHQQGDVWFLAGTYGTQRTVRTCTVPAGKHLFFPLINYIVYPRRGHTPTCKAVVAQAAAMTDDASALVLEVDGRQFEGLYRHRQATTECFDLGVALDPPMEVFPSAANGFYVMLRPLSPGKHILNFGGASPSMFQAVTYTLYPQ